MRCKSPLPVLAIVALMAGRVPAQAPGFTDVTVEAGVTFVFAPAQSLDMEWHGGGTEGDFNADGWPDLFIVGGGNTHDRLFMNNHDGTFTDTSVAAGLTALYRGNGANAADYDNDGDMDIYVTSFGDLGAPAKNGQHKLWRNNGDGTFTNVAVAAGVNSTGTIPDGQGVCWGDYDLDGDLDLCVTGWHAPATNKLFRNNLKPASVADFTDVTAAAGLFTNLTNGFGAIFADMDGDRHPELLVAGDFGTSRYYRNNKNGTFTEQTWWVAGDTKVYNGMGTCLGDWNRDGRPDWFLSAIYPAWQFEGADGNRLYVNQGGGTFQSLPASAGVNDSGWAWGTSMIDFDNDSWQDLVVTNGWFYCDPVTLACFGNEPTYLYRNNGNNTFTEQHAAQNLINLYQGRGLITFDYDRDGDMDIVILSNPTGAPGDDPATGNLKLYRNNVCGPSGPSAGANYLEVRLDSSAHPALPPNGWGAEVWVTAGGVTQCERIHGGSNFLSRSQPVAHFGLHGATVVDVLSVTWPNGQAKTLTNVPGNQLLTVSADALPASPWTDLGLAKPGIAGLPHLAGTGTLAPSSANQLRLVNAAPSSTATVVFGLTVINAPFKGGTLIATPVVMIGLPTNASGATTLPFTFPATIPSGLSFYFQFWNKDTAATFNLSASNGVRGTAP